MISSATYSTDAHYQGPILQFNHETRLWRLVVDYAQEWGPAGFRKRLFLAAGYEYDKASTPRLMRAIAKHDEEWEGPALWHDKLYAEKGEFLHLDIFRFETKINGLWRVDAGRWRRKDADNWLEYDGILAGVPPAEAKKYKWAVKLYPPNWFKGF